MKNRWAALLKRDQKLAKGGVVTTRRRPRAAEESTQQQQTRSSASSGSSESSSDSEVEEPSAKRRHVENSSALPQSTQHPRAPARQPAGAVILRRIQLPMPHIIAKRPDVMNMHAH